MNKTHILFHANCFDGYGAALAAYLKFREEANYIPVLHGQPPPDMPADSAVYILDFSYPRETLLKMYDRYEFLYVIDHHKTAQADLAGLDFAKFDMKKSGAVLAWEHFQSGSFVPRFFKYLQDRDLWEFKLDNSREIAAAMRMYPFDFTIWTQLMDESVLERLAMEGQIVLKMTNQVVETMCAQAKIMTIGGYDVPVANATFAFSEVGERLLAIHSECQFAAYYFDRKDGIRQWGLRSRPDFDCSEIAKQFGGGGHKQAAGFQQPIQWALTIATPV